MKHIAVIGLRGFPGVQGGVEKHCEHLIPLLSRHLKCIVYRRKPYLSAESSAEIPGISYVDLPSSRIKGVEAMLHTFLSVLNLPRRKVDVVNVHNIGPGLFTPLLRLMGYKVVLTYHSPNYEHAKWGRLARMILRTGEALALRFSNRIIFVNRFQMEKYAGKIRRKSVYIPNGVDNAQPTTDTGFLDRHGIKPGQYVLAVGRITPEKGFEHLVKAVNMLPEVPQLVIAGGCDHDSEYLQQLKTIDRCGKVIFTGQTDSSGLRQLYSHARMFVLSSINEGFPLVMLESMSYGVPMIVSDIPATHLVDLPAESYFPAADSSSMASRIRSLYSLDQHRISYDLDAFSWPAVADRTLAVYQSLRQPTGTM